MDISENLRRLIDANAPYWAGEAEVVRTYWVSPIRSIATDSSWVLRQMYKELWDGVCAPLSVFRQSFDEMERGVDRYAMLDLSKLIHEEFEHYCLFADLYDTLCPQSSPFPDPEYLKEYGNWPENRELMEMRAVHRRQHGNLGWRAHMFTESGYCTLFSEGMKLEGRGGLDDSIAQACARVYSDEFDHMLRGIVDIDDGSMSAADWSLLTELTVEQLRQRIRMRNAQFGHPVSDARLSELCAGRCAPLSFDYGRAMQRRDRLAPSYSGAE